MAKAVGLALSPVLYGLHIGAALLGWAVSNLSASMQLPLRLLTAALQLADGLICDLLAVISREPGLKSQVRVRVQDNSCPGGGAHLSAHSAHSHQGCSGPRGTSFACPSRQNPLPASLAAAVGLCVLTHGQSVRGS